MARSDHHRRTQVERSMETRALLTAAAIEVLRTVGYARATTQLIAERAGVTRGALHHHFSTKEDLMMAVLDNAAARLRSRLQEFDGIPCIDARQTRALVDHLWQTYGDPEYWAVWEVIIGTRADAAMHRAVIEHRAKTTNTVLVPWLDLAIPSENRDELLRTLEFVFITIRGLRLERFLDKPESYFAAQLSLLAEFLALRIRAALANEASPVCAPAVSRPKTTRALNGTERPRSRATPSAKA